MPRRQLSDRISWDDSYFFVAYTVDAVDLAIEEGDKELAPIAKILKPLLDRYDALTVERRKRERAVNKSHVRVRRTDIDGDALVTEVHNEALSAAKLDRAAPAYKRLFPDPLSTVVRLGLESELVLVRALHAGLGHASVAKSVKRFAPSVAALIKRAESALDARRKAYAARSDVGLDLQSWRDDVNNALLGVEGELTRVAAKRKLTEAWVMTFFPAPLATKKKRAGSEPTPAPEG
jgi:hypothetical protein